MSRRLMSAEQFAHGCPDGAVKPPGLVYRLATTDASQLDRQTGRVIPYILSTGAVARDNHTIAPAGWQLGNFRTNPVFLWAHESSEPPIGKLTDISISNGALRGIVEYADADTYPFADTIFRLVKGGFLNSVSVSWDPIRWSYSTDRSRPGGIDFLEQELREVSQVPVPCDVTAIATARAAGIDTGPLYAWAERVLDSGDSIVIPRAELEDLRREAKMPSTRQTSVAAPVYVPQPRSAMPAGPLVRDLYDVGYLTDAVNTMAYVQWSMAQETAWEGDNSPLPDRLLAILKAAGQLLIDSTAEEVNELIASLDEGGERSAPTDALTGAQALKQFAMDMVRRVAAPVAAQARMAAIKDLDARGMALLMKRGMLAPAGQTALADLILARAGKALSARNEADLRTAHDHMRAAADCVRGVVASNNPDTAPDPLAPVDDELVSQEADSEDDATRAARTERSRLARAAIASAAVAAAAE